MSRPRLIAVAGVLLGLALAAAVLWPGDAKPPLETGPAVQAQPGPVSDSRTQPDEGREARTNADASRSDGFVMVINAADGQPLPGADVSLSRVATRELHMRSSDYRAQTDARGRADFPALPEEEYDLTVYLDHYRTLYGRFISGQTVTLAPIPILHGRVVSDDKTPVAGAVVTSATVRSEATRTATDGTFSLHPSILGRLVAHKDGLFAVSADLHGNDEELSKPIELVLIEQELYDMKTVLRSGAPLAGVLVKTDIGELHLTQVTAADGIFDVPAFDDVFIDVHIVKEGFGPVRRTFLGSIADTTDVVMSRPSRLEGQVVDLSGTPVPDAQVRVEWGSEFRDWPESVRVDAQGRFAFDPLSQAQVEVTAIGTAEEVAQLTVALPEGTTTQVKLVIPPARVEVPFQVVTTGGIELDTYQVLATPIPPQGWESHAGPYQDELRLTRGRFAVHVETPSGRFVDTVIDVDPRPEMTPLRFVVHGDGGQQFEDELPPTPVRVRVVNPAGVPVVGAEVRCHNDQGQTGTDGRYECQVRGDDHAWPIQVLVTKDGATGLGRATGKEAELKVVLAPKLTLRGRVDGVLPPSDVSLVLRAADGDMSVPLIGNSFAVENQAPIRTFLCVLHSPPGGEESELGCAVSEAGEEVVIPVGKQGTLTFTALDSKGAVMTSPITWLDRVRLQDGPPLEVQKLEVAPGNHVMVLNDEHSRARYEAHFSVQPGKTTALGKLKLQ